MASGQELGTLTTGADAGLAILQRDQRLIGRYANIKYGAAHAD
jgi:hypothetical protein